MKKPSKAKLADAVLSMRHLLALASDPRGRIQDEKRMHARVTRMCAGIAKATGTDGLNASEVWQQIETRARQLGPLVPLLGRDL
jgi:hypothetical protein